MTPQLSSFTKDNWPESQHLCWGLLFLSNHCFKGHQSFLQPSHHGPWVAVLKPVSTFCPVRFGTQTFTLPCGLAFPEWSYSWLVPAPADFAISWFQLHENAFYSHRTAQRPLMGADLGESSFEVRQWQFPKWKGLREKGQRSIRSHLALPPQWVFSI